MSKNHLMKPDLDQQTEEDHHHCTKMEANLKSYERNFLANQSRRRRELLNSKLSRKTEFEESTLNTNDRDKFWSLFRSECSQLHKELDQKIYSDTVLKSVPKKYVTAQQRLEGRATLDEVTARLVYFESPNNIPDLVGGDLRLFSQEMTNLKSKIERLQKTVCPPEKFTFKRYHDIKKNSVFDDDKRDNNTNSMKADAEDKNQFLDPVLLRRFGSLQKIKGSPSNEISSEQLKNETWRDITKQEENKDKKTSVPNNNVRFVRYEKDKNIVVDDGDSTNRSIGKALRLKNLTNCKVDVRQSFGTINCISLSNCFLYLYPVTGSIFIQDCNDCTIYLASQQIRTHDSKNLKIHAMVASGPIIEGCSGIEFFGDYSEGMWDNVGRRVSGGNEDDYLISMRNMMLQCTLLKDATKSGELKGNQFHSVKDFNWHKKQKSPHFDVVVSNKKKKTKHSEHSDDSEDEL